MNSITKNMMLYLIFFVISTIFPILISLKSIYSSISFEKRKIFINLISDISSKKDNKTRENTIKYPKGNRNESKITVVSVLFIIFTLFLRIKGYYSVLRHNKSIRRNEHGIKTSHFNSKRLYNSDVIGCSVPACINESINQGRSYCNVSINISNCFFSRSFVGSGSGGVIFISGGVLFMNISFSMFYNCVCSDSGGAIFFSSYNSILRMVCANMCSSINYGHFAYLYSYLINQVEYLSVSKCSRITEGKYPFMMNSWYQRVDDSNSSMNSAQLVSGFCSSSPSSAQSSNYPLSCSHCTFSNNNVSMSICINFNNQGTVSYAIIVHNNSPAGNGVVNVNHGPIKMNYCIFDMNQYILFSLHSGKLEVSHSFISHSASLSSHDSVSISNNNSFSKKQTYFYEYYSSKYCKSQITTVEQTNTGNSYLYWIISFIVFSIVLTLLVLTMTYHRIATNFQARDQLEHSLQIDFG